MRARYGCPYVFAVLLVAAVAAGCGESVELPDLFIVQRTGGSAPLTLVVNEGGAVRCNSGPARQLSDSQLVLARGVQEELEGPAAKHLALASRPGSVFSYYLRDEKGTVRFADNSAGQPSALRHLAYLVLEIAQKVCRLPGEGS
ncbi:MAG TPA: hypothetical protein VK756_07005 [Solirubrobacteraceae bacterium]|nr:hypothetical protein [Solirubrobacteraceae bacterium]